MHKVMIAGTGKIGSLIANLLLESGDYEVHLIDLDFSGTDIARLLHKTLLLKTMILDVKDEKALVRYLVENNIVAVISSLPYFLTHHVAQAARVAHVHYFDLTEDVSVTKAVKKLAKDASTAFIPQCGLAPGFISIVAHSLIQEFDECFHAKLRVGALPQRASNALHYSLTWSTDGVINQYGNSCYGIENRQLAILKPLEGLELIEIDGCEYEAFNTSGGLGNLAELYVNKIQTLNYKTIRYPGHCEKMRFLMNDLKLNEDRSTLKRILERALPKTYQDLVIVYVTVEGLKNAEWSEKSYMKKIYPAEVNGLEWSAIQVSTAAGVSAVVDLTLSQMEPLQGFILQERFHLSDILANRFGRYFI